MSMLTFNMADGFAEGIVRGFRSGFLSEDEYHHLTQCETIEDIKMNLQETDFGNFLQAESPPVMPAIIEKRATSKWVTEFKYMRSIATGDLAQFLDFVTYEYMIENILLLLKATLTEEAVSAEALVEQSHELGRFKPSAMKTILAFTNSPSGYADLYSTVLIDTPVGKYFSMYLQDQIEKKSLGGASEVRHILEEVPIATLEHTVMKLYLEDFYYFCQSLPSETARVMGHILKERSDAISINITLNSFDTFLNQPSHRASSRKALYPSFGYLYPEGIDALCRVEDEDGITRVLAPYPQYRAIWDSADIAEGGERLVDDAFFQRNVRVLEHAFDGQFHYGMFYAFVKLKEQEVKNLVWICECLLQGQTHASNKFIPIFPKHK